eukprot:scaffold5687_cov139-Amphora_coffeaeformis.AAC.1
MLVEVARARFNSKVVRLGSDGYVRTKLFTSLVIVRPMGDGPVVALGAPVVLLAAFCCLDFALSAIEGTLWRILTILGATGIGCPVTHSSTRPTTVIGLVARTWTTALD